MITGSARVSSREQAENSNALKQQIEQLKSAGCEKIYTDVESGRWKRKGLEKLMEDARAGLISKVIAVEVSRFGRNLLDGKAKIHELLELGIEVVFLREQIDLSTSAGMMVFNFMLSYAEGESKRISERICDGWEYLRNQVRAIHPPFGYEVASERYVLNKKLFLCRLEDGAVLSRADIAREIVELFFKHQALFATLQAFNCRYGLFATNKPGGKKPGEEELGFSPAGLLFWLKNPVLQGDTCYLKTKGSWFSKKVRRIPPENWIIYKDTHPEEIIISREEFSEIERILSENKKRKGFTKPGNTYPLSGLVVCEECRSCCYAVKGTRGKNKKNGNYYSGHNYYYQCAKWRDRRCGQKRMVQMEQIERALIEILVSKAHEISQFSCSKDEKTESSVIIKLRSCFASAAAPQIEALEKLGDNPAILNALEDLREQVEKNKRNEAEGRRKEAVKLLEVFSDINYFETLSSEDKRTIFQGLVSQITIKDGKISAIRLKI